MAEYRTLLIRAISRLDANTLTARESVYARARAALAALLEPQQDHSRTADEAYERERRGLDEAIAEVEASMAKAIGGKAARRISQECLELLGPLALSEDFLAEKWFRDARIFDIFEGAGEINRLIVARWLLGYSAKELA